MIERVKPSARECALLFLKAVEERNSRRKPSARLRIPEVSLRRICIRNRLTPEFLDELQEWMLSAGWLLIQTGKFFGALKVQAVEGWPRLGSARIAPLLTEVADGSCDFEALEYLWPRNGEQSESELTEDEEA